MKARRFAGVVLAAVMLLGTLFATGQTAWAEGNADTMTSSDTTDTTLVAADDGDVTGVTLVPDTATLAVGETVQLTATISPEDASDKTVIWTVDDDDYVKLYADAGCTIEVSDGTTPTLTVYAKGLAEGSASINVASNQNIVI